MHNSFYPSILLSLYHSTFYHLSTCTFLFPPHIYVKKVVNNFNEIWLGSDESILLVVDNESKNEKPRYQIVALQMNEMIDDEKKVCWNVHTAQSRKKRSPKNTLLWKK